MSKRTFGNKRFVDMCRRGDRGLRRVATLRGIVRDYRVRFRPLAQQELNYFAGLQTLREAVTEAGLARMPNGKRYPHQRRIPGRKLERGTRLLLKAGLDRCCSFDELLRCIEGTICTIKGVGELTAYDTALRIGAYLGLSPNRVYLHAGARVGARALGFDHTGRSIDPSDLPPPLRELEPHEVEDVLCIYKDWLSGT